MENPDAYKKAAIDWVLTNGECESMTSSTRLALADLSVRGVDYEKSDLPDFRHVALDPGDSFTDATFGEAFAADIYPLGRDPQNWRDVYTFHIDPTDMQRLLISHMIAGVLAAAEQGDAGWKQRADDREVERLQRHQAAAELRAARSRE